MAHGGEVTILAKELVQGYVDYIEVLGNAICDVLKSEWLRQVVERRAVALGRAINLFNREIVCFVSLDVPIKRGDVLISKAEDDRFRCGFILQMQVNSQDVQEIERVGPDGVGLRVNFSPKANHVFFLLSMASPQAAETLETDLFANAEELADSIEVLESTDEVEVVSRDGETEKTTEADILPVSDSQQNRR